MDSFLLVLYLLFLATIYHSRKSTMTQALNAYPGLFATVSSFVIDAFNTPIIDENPAVLELNL